MTKLRRTYEAAEEEGRPIEEVALERYGSLEAFEEAKEERRVLDERGDRRKSRRESGFGGGPPRDGARTPTGMAADGGGRRFVFTEMDTPGDGSRPSSRQSFRRPGEAPPDIARSSSTSSITGGATSGSRGSTPIPSVLTPPVARRMPSALSQSTLADPDPTSTGAAVASNSSAPLGSTKPVLSQSELNKLQARVLKAKLMQSDDAADLEAEYERELKRSMEAGPAVAEKEGMEQTLGGSRAQGQDVQVLPTVDGRGRMYDVGVGTAMADKYEEERKAKGRRAKKEMVRPLAFPLMLAMLTVLALSGLPVARSADGRSHPQQRRRRHTLAARPRPPRTLLGRTRRRARARRFVREPDRDRRAVHDGPRLHRRERRKAREGQDEE